MLALSESLPHIVYKRGAAVASLHPDYKSAFTEWKRMKKLWADAGDLHAPVFIGTVSREIDPGVAIVDVNE